VSESDSPMVFVLGLAARAAFLFVAAVSVNLFVDPFGTHGTHIFEPITLSSRRPKLRLYREHRPAPEIVILGSSRSFSMEAAYIEAQTSRPTFNASVHGGGPRDYIDLATCFTQAHTFPSILIVGLGVEQMLGSAETPVEHDDPLGECRPSGAPVREFLTTHVGAVAIQETWASLRVLALEVTGRPAPAYTFGPDGTVQGGFHAPLEEAVDSALAGNWAPGAFAAERLDPRRVEQVRLLLGMSRARGARVIVYLPPYHPRALARYERESNFGSLREQLLARLAEWSREYPLSVFDFTDVASFGGRSAMFYDASHPREDAYRLMVHVMRRDLV
jgi:hypothetical protein